MTQDELVEIIADAVARIGEPREMALEQARAILSALTARGLAVVPGWQPIETAPKNGTRVILSWGGNAVTGYYLDNSMSQWPWQGWKVPSMEKTPAGAPAAWMPLPAALPKERRHDHP